MDRPPAMIERLFAALSLESGVDEATQCNLSLVRILREIRHKLNLLAAY